MFNNDIGGFIKLVVTVIIIVVVVWLMWRFLGGL